MDAILDSTSDTIIVNWTAPGGEFTGYKAKIAPSDAKKSKVDIKDVNQTRAEFTGLMPNKKYKVTVLTMSGQTESEKVTLQDKTSESNVITSIKVYAKLTSMEMEQEPFLSKVVQKLRDLYLVRSIW